MMLMLSPHPPRRRLRCGDVELGACNDRDESRTPTPPPPPSHPRLQHALVVCLLRVAAVSHRFLYSQGKVRGGKHADIDMGRTATVGMEFLRGQRYNEQFELQPCIGE
eukprot:6184718-Pleurochrysis_carterae.AAC.4